MANLSETSRSMTTAILAGGAATRLGGVDKGLMPLSGQPLIARVIESLDQGTRWPCLIVANRNIEAYSRFAPTISDQDKNAFAGPLAGVAAALAACETEWLYTLPVDSVRANALVATRLLQHALENNVACAVAHDGHRRQPLFAVYRRHLGESADSALAAKYGVSHWQDSIAAREVDCSDLGDEWINLNTAEDFLALADRLSP